MTRPAPPPSLFHLAVMSNPNGNAAMKPISLGAYPDGAHPGNIPAGLAQSFDSLKEPDSNERLPGVRQALKSDPLGCNCLPTKPATSRPQTSQPYLESSSPRKSLW